MAAKPQIDYQGYNQTASDIPETESPAGRGPHFELHANPEEFGGAIGGALQQFGKEGQQVGADISEFALKKMQLQNETAAASGETALIQANADARAKFMATEGTETSKMLPQYQQMLNSNYQSIRSTLNGGALRQFDMLALRQNANYNTEAVSYESGQVKKANMMAHASLINATQAQANNPNLDAAGVGQLTGTATYAHGAMMDEDHPGLQKDGDGNFSYASTPEGQDLKANMQNNIDHSKGIIWQNVVTAKANVNPLDAQQFYQDNKDNIPPMAQARIEAFLHPQVDNYKANGIVNTAYTMGRQDYQKMALNPTTQSDSIADAIHKYGEGGGLNSTTSVNGAVGGWQILPTTFQQYAKPGENINNPADNEAVGRRIVSDLKSKYPNDPARVAVGYFSGPGNVAPPGSANPWVEDKKDGNGTSVSQYVQKVTNGLGQQPQGKPAYATNPDGSRMTDADYFATHREQVLQMGQQMAERDFPGNPTYQSMIRERLTQQMDASIRDQAAQYRQDNMYISKAVFGGLTQGKIPASTQELMAIPGVSGVLSRVYAQDPKFAEGIDRMISMANRGVDTANSANAYDTIQRTLEPAMKDDGTNNDNRIRDQAQLDGLLGKTDGTGINMKDYKDAKGVLEAPQAWKDFLRDGMKSSASANGNLDGQGQQRAVDWYNKVNQLYGTASKKDGFDVDDFIQNLKEGNQPQQPSRMEQIANWAKSLLSSPQQAQATVKVVNPNGQTGTIPSGQLQDALKAGYKQVQ